MRRKSKDITNNKSIRKKTAKMAGYPEVARIQLREFKVTATYTQKVVYYIMASNHEQAKSLYDKCQGVEFKVDIVEPHFPPEVHDMTVKVVARLDKD